jgi:hypothetical protein
MAEHDKDETTEEVWAIYRFRNPVVDACDAKLALLARFIEKRRNAGEDDREELLAEGLALLQRLDRHGDADVD